ncbi:SHOCT domain-containing protein [Pseudoflavonifractor sp. AF19-9AC]|uniref:SHOCT domain-containing protein n=1 Tax=Pseudoflavonifractor sp. AF19-9AC TaxID=2292244 RepID=UPI000E48ADB3|nr:SHOCT domain-containing protein [Pseudoflavonifractor sp. AF19-9AC]RHR10822.1 SHOCT domain-containing protein [Pseudoflavonifractor sp. AF19-9AC]
MGGTAISILGGVLPLRVNFLFFVLVAVVGYGIYLPYQEKRSHRSGPSKDKKSSGPRAGREQTGRTIGTLLMCVLLGILLLWALGFFLMSLIFAPLMGGMAAVLLVVLSGLMVVLPGVLLWRVVRGERQGRRKKVERVPPAAAPEKLSEQHDHVPSAAASVQERLEQLTALKEAGLLDKAEYEQRRERILKGQ